MTFHSEPRLQGFGDFLAVCDEFQSYAFAIWSHDVESAWKIIWSIDHQLAQLFDVPFGYFFRDRKSYRNFKRNPNFVYVKVWIRRNHCSS